MRLLQRIGGAGNAVSAWMRGFAADARGNVAMLFGMTLPVLLMVVAGGIDISRISTAKAGLQDALDAAGLAAARSPYTEAADIQRVGMDALRANLATYPTISLIENETTFVLVDDERVVADAKVNVKTLIANIVLPPYGQIMDDELPVGVHSEVRRSSKNVEVALVLDITGSMAGSRITSLRDAARQLTDIVVQSQQQPYYSRMAVVPYSTAVNLGDMADDARGNAVQSTSITAANWSTGITRSITAVSKANPGYITSANHGFKNNDYVWISGIKGMTQLNAKPYRVANAGTDTFSLQSWNGSTWNAVNTSSNSNYTSNGTVSGCLLFDCTIVVTSRNHGLSATDPATGAQAGIRITDVNGLTQANTTSATAHWLISNVTTDTFSINLVGPTAGSYTSGGKVWCGNDGCQWRVYRNASGAMKVYQISNCVSERTGSNKYNDTRPSLSPVGRYYPNPGGSNTKCTTSPMLSLTDDKAAINALIGPVNNASQGLQADGYTAAQIGLAWGWYSVSPEFNSLWSAFPAAGYDTQRTLKAVILMTDGEFNAPYCSGVLSRDASFGGNDRANCDSTNGEPYTQARALCSAIKNKNVVIYTVGFQVSASSTAGKFLRDCATNPSNFFLPSSGSDLTSSFKAIGRDITQLRIAR